MPVLISFATAPYLTWFNLVEYHVFYRQVRWGGATQHDFGVLASWVDSGQTLLLGLFAVAGLCLVRERKPEFYLAAWMAVGLSLEAAVAHPTFPQYFIFMAPFLAILAGTGFCEVASRLSLPLRWAVPALAALLLLSLGNSLTDVRADNNTWTNMETLARKVKQVASERGGVGRSAGLLCDSNT